MSGFFDVYELYGEARIPIVEDLPFIEELNLEVAGRLLDGIGHTPTLTAAPAVARIIEERFGV